jgi:hypothetical protein
MSVWPCIHVANLRTSLELYIEFASTFTNNLKFVECIEYFLLKNVHFYALFAAPCIVPHHSPPPLITPHYTLHNGIDTSPQYWPLSTVVKT